MTDDTNRPWSPAEVEAEIGVVLRDLDKAVTDVRQAAINAATARRDHKREEAKAGLKVTGKNAEERRARIYLTQVEPGGKTVGDLEYEADLAAGVEKSTTAYIRVLEKRGDLLRSLLVSSRTVT